MLISQISWVIKLVIAQQVLLIQISLGLLLVMKQQMQVFKFHWSLRWSKRNKRWSIKFLGYQAGYSATSANNSNLGITLVLAQQMLVIQISLGLLLVEANAESSNFFGQ
jgi:hypothetical protein